ncbi:mannose-1-phosphate guanylyltransferase, partial [Candidatus Desantisbacteria bacterium]|nr:mannose-1-phosphate guanylyltransferase [Candidatus Desantisbacteria bacterium]
MAVYAVIMAGGSGTRFWPVSRQSIPKQCLHITGGNSMIQETVERLSPIIILEPVARNTASCIGLSMIHLLHHDPEAVVLLETADHYYHDGELYCQHLLRAIDYATTHDNICLVGIKPFCPATGYGYIQQGNLIDDQGIRIFGVQRFVEKPALEIAKKYVESGEYLWNSGIFIARAQVMLDEIAMYMPHLYAGLMRIQTALKGGDERVVDMVTREVF